MRQAARAYPSRRQQIVWQVESDNIVQPRERRAVDIRQQVVTKIEKIGVLFSGTALRFCEARSTGCS